MVDFLHYVESTDEKIAEASESDRIKQIHACVSRIKASEEAGVKYMQNWEEKIIEREKALAEGRREGREEGRQATILDSLESLMETTDWSAEQALDALKVFGEEREHYLEMVKN